MELSMSGTAEVTSRRRSKIVTAALAVGAILLAGCSSATAGGGNGDTIRLGVMGDHTSQSQTSYSGIPRVIELAVERLNAQGGIAGKQVEIVECDLQGVPDQASRCARDMVHAEVTAVLAQVGFGIEKVPPIFEAARIPYLPAYTLSAAYMESEASFPVVPGILSQMAAAWLSGEVGCTKPVVVTLQGPTTDYMRELVGIGARAGGGVVPRFVTAPLNTTDYAPIAAEVVADNPDCVMPYMSETLNSVFYPALEQTGWKSRSPQNRLVGYQGGVYTQRILEEFPALVEGMQAVDMSRPFNDPSWREFNEIEAQLEGERLTNLTSSFTKHSYINLQAWTDAVRQVAESGAEITNETVFETFATSAGIDTQGFTAPFTTTNAQFPKWPRFFNTSVILEEFRNGEIVQLNNGDFVDLRDDIAGALV
jgi:ABC-type branched-subunit amino acid transport system substrate-binding protein